ncbi:glycine cleavage system H protein, partial [Circinella umbellata]
FIAKKYTDDHEWISIEDGVGTIGITDYAQKALGDVVFVETPAVGDVVEKKDQMGAVESVKAASDIYSPITGEVVNVNEALADEPSLINTSPEEDGWLAKIKLSNPEEIEGLMDEKAYAELCASEEEH